MVLESTIIWYAFLTHPASPLSHLPPADPKDLLWCKFRLTTVWGSTTSLDNSEWMRNGDYFPSRMEAQIDAVNVVMGWKFQSNPENTVGVLKMAKGYAHGLCDLARQSDRGGGLIRALAPVQA
jgi:hypothetical protein